MALLGFPIVLSLIGASILQKLSARYSLGRKYLATGLFRYLHPSTEDLKVAAGHATAGTKGGARKRRNDQKDDRDAEGFLVPKTSEIKLETATVQSMDVLSLPFYVDYRWLIDFCFITIIVFFFSEAYSWVFPRRSASELNLSILWCLILLFLCLKSLTALSANYFKEENDTGERSLVLSFGAISFLFMMVFLLVAEKTFDVGFMKAYENFTSNTNEFLKLHDVELGQNRRSPILLFLFIAVLFGFVGGMLVFPSFRYARMYTDALSYASVIGKLFLHTSFFLPLVIIALWIKPLAEDQLVNRDNALMTLEQLESIRLCAVLLLVVLRILTARPCLQAYLNIAHQKVTQLQTEAGRINSLELQRMVARIFFYLCAVALQYFIPVFLLLGMVLILKNQGGYSWLAAMNLPADPPFVSLLPFDTLPAPSKFWSEDPNSGMGSGFLSIYLLLNHTVCRGIWNLIFVSTLVMTFALNVIGVVYNSRFSD